MHWNTVGTVTKCRLIDHACVFIVMHKDDPLLCESSWIT